VPRGQTVSKMMRGSVDQLDQSVSTRRSSSESGYSEDINMTLRELQGVKKYKTMEDTLSHDLSNVQLRSPRNPFPSQLYSYQWDMPSLWRESNTDTTKKVIRTEIYRPALSSGYPAASETLPTAPTKPKTFPPIPTKQYSSSSEKSCEDWLRLKLQQKTVEIPPPSLPPQISTSDLPKRLHISNIPFRFREPHVFYMFSKFGEVTDAEIIYNDKGSKGFGFVTLSKGKDADMAQMSLHGSTVEGRVIEVNLATPKMIPSSRSIPTISPLPDSWQYQQFSHPPPLPTRTFPPSYSTTSLLEAQTRLAEAQLAVLQMQQKMIHSQYRVDKSEVEDRVDWSRKREDVGTIGGW